ncbi:hypothetical protein OBBRIDRAFT_264424 [Obba rivulosa]|uniref:Uncharacterized protein n=1 Tax=Obba rivulosa TaxID=1052685 RepID=A0A8E2AK35_9APHY|nr:hypothetical protein OBBRIDRAFT_264424 [Obba rivulosa]
MSYNALVLRLIVACVSPVGSVIGGQVYDHSLVSWNTLSHGNVGVPAISYLLSAVLYLGERLPMRRLRRRECARRSRVARHPLFTHRRSCVGMMASMFGHQSVTHFCLTSNVMVLIQSQATKVPTSR